MKLEIKICMGSSCFARGNTDNLEFIEEFIKKNALEATVEIVGARCEDKCAKGPNIFINDVEHNNITKEKLEEILGGHKDE